MLQLLPYLSKYNKISSYNKAYLFISQITLCKNDWADSAFFILDICSKKKFVNVSTSWKMLNPLKKIFIQVVIYNIRCLDYEVNFIVHQTP